MKIPFNKPYLSGNELNYIKEAVENGHISGDGAFTKRCHAFFDSYFDTRKSLLTTSCTDALEMSALLINLKPGDEVILPSFTFVSTANAFALRGAKLVFADSNRLNPNLCVDDLKTLINRNTKAIVPVHYAGIACDMDEINTIASENNLYVIEDAAQGIDSYYKGKRLGTFGNLSAFSFHETKNIISGEGGLLVVNDKKFVERAEIIREKGTNRSQFFRGQVDKYSWVDLGSSFLTSDIIAAYLYAQLEEMDRIQLRRKEIWDLYNTGLEKLEGDKFIERPHLPDYATNNGHMFYITCRSLAERTDLINYLKKKGIMAVFHYIPLHSSSYYKSKHDGRVLHHCDNFSERLLRLPLYYELTNDQISYIIKSIEDFFVGK